MVALATPGGQRVLGHLPVVMQFLEIGSTAANFIGEIPRGLEKQRAAAPNETEEEYQGNTNLRHDPSCDPKE
jgi:hypothetical protein